MTECSAYDNKGRTCHNGFIQTYSCWGKVDVCKHCGTPSSIPNCLRDELPEHWVKKDGSPMFYRDIRERE